MAEGRTTTQGVEICDVQGRPSQRRAGPSYSLATGVRSRASQWVRTWKATDLTHAQLVRRLECEPDTERRDLPDDTNARVTAAAAALAELLAKPTTLEPRTRDDSVTKYVNDELRQLRQTRLGEEVDPGFLRHLETLRRAFNEEMPLSIAERIKNLMRRRVEGTELVDELSKMMDELPKPGEAGEPQQIRDSRVEIICSMGIISPD